MATTIILPPAAAVETAVNELRAAAGSDAKRLAALNKAQYDLLLLQPQILRVSGAYLVPSTTRAGLIHRVADVGGCDCEAGRSGHNCRHAVAIELIEQANMHTMPALATSPDAKRDAYERALAAMNELFA